MGKSRQSKIMSYIKEKVYFKMLSKTIRVKRHSLEDCNKQINEAVKTFKKLEDDISWLQDNSKLNK